MEQLKKAWIIGANSDIAKELLLRMDGEFEILAVSRNICELKKFIGENHLNMVTPVELDVCDRKELQIFLESYEFPNTLIFAQGILRTEENVLDYLDEMVQCNYVACIQIIETIWKKMMLVKSGCIVGITSVAADRGKMSNKLYSSTKAAFSSYLQALMQEGSKKGVQVINVKPGYVRSKMLKSYPKSYRSVLATTPSKAAKCIWKKMKKGKSGTLYIRPIWRLIVWLIRILPERIYMRMNL